MYQIQYVWFGKSLFASSQITDCPLYYVLVRETDVEIFKLPSINISFLQEQERTELLKPLMLFIFH